VKEDFAKYLDFFPENVEISLRILVFYFDTAVFILYSLSFEISH